MKLSKQEIYKALESITVPGEGQNMIESRAVKNVVTFGDEVIVDITIANPSLPNFDGSTVTFVLQVKDDTDLYVTEVCTWDNSSNPITCDFVGN